MNLERYDDALNLLVNDYSLEAYKLRAEIAWTRENWVGVARSLALLLNDSVVDNQDLTEQERDMVLKIAIAYNMENDRENLENLREKWYSRLEGTVEGESFDALNGCY